LEEQWDADGLSKALEADFGLDLDIARLVAEDKSINDDGIREHCIEEARKAYAEREQKIGSELMRNVEKQVMLRQLDHHWKEHLAAMDHLRQGIGLRSYAQKNPKQEYKREAFEMFGAMMEQVKHDTISILTRIRIQGEDDLAEMQRQREEQQKLKFQHAQASALG
ncbi:MAG: preprotein translocase subunit SecA, partial [Gammaproteobacteria bacterium]|nr:preprotein translocase subunit SecA [Gammaproteobacteria bacterium]